MRDMAKTVLINCEKCVTMTHAERNLYMLVVVTGVSGSGKSEYAENRAVRLSGGENLYYVATMEPYGDEGRRRIERHHKLRAGKGFTTVECYRNIEQVIDVIGAAKCRESTVLVECMSNLLANEMFGTQEEPKWSEQARAQEVSLADRLLSGTSILSRQCKHLIVVTNEVFSDGNTYDEETMVYIKLLGKINCGLAGMADETVEVVYSVPQS